VHSFSDFPSALHDVLEDRVAAILRLPVFSPDFCQLLVVCRKDSTLLFFSRKSYIALRVDIGVHLQFHGIGCRAVLVPGDTALNHLGLPFMKLSGRKKSMYSGSGIF